MADIAASELKTIKEFLIEPFIAAVENKEFEGKWTAQNSRLG